MKAQLGRRAPELDEVIVGRSADHLEPAGGLISWLPIEMGHCRVFLVERAIGELGLPVLVDRVNLFDVEKCQQVAIDIAQGQRLALLGTMTGGDRQGNGQGPERAIGQAHLGDDTVIVGLAHEPAKRREPAHTQQFQVAETAFVQGQACMILGGRLHLGCALRTDDKIDQRASVGRIQLGLRLCGNFQAPSLLPTREPNQLAHSAPEMFDNSRELGKNGIFLRFGQPRHPNKRNFSIGFLSLHS